MLKESKQGIKFKWIKPHQRYFDLNRKAEMLDIKVINNKKAVKGNTIKTFHDLSIQPGILNYLTL